MLNNLFSGAASETEIPDIEAEMSTWFKEPVLYEGLIVTRSTAFQLCAETTHSWAEMDAINDLERFETAGMQVLDAATAYSHIYQRDHYRSFGRDV